jgi:hypothetical protein
LNGFRSVELATTVLIGAEPREPQVLIKEPTFVNSWMRLFPSSATYTLLVLRFIPIPVGPDGYLYIVSIGEGKVFRILPG